MRAARLGTCLVIAATFNAGSAMAQAQGTPAPATTPTSTPTPRAQPPTRDPHTPGYVTAKDLPDGTVPSPDVDDNFIIGPTHPPAPETMVQEGVPQGAIHKLTMSSADNKIYPGIARDPGTFGTPDPNDPTNLIVTTSHPAAYTRNVSVYVPKQYVPGTAAPFIVGADGPDALLFATLDNLIAQKRVPVMIAISIGNGGGDAQGSERGLEYDTMSGRYAEFVETEVLPLVEKECAVKLTKDPEGRATMGGSSGGSAALIMAWYRNDLYHRVLAYSITAINQQWPHDPKLPGGAWEFHKSLIPNDPVKPIRIWLEVGDRDLLNPNVMRDEMHDWVLASENMARVLAAKGYHYQFTFARNTAHTERPTKQQTLPEALEYVWKGYPR
jgi:enterochelin esterase family protein